jgi:hypothetical protein
MIIASEPMEVDLARRAAARRRADRGAAATAWAITVLAMFAVGWVSLQPDHPAQRVQDEVGAILAIGQGSIQPARAAQRTPEALRAVLAPTSTI